MRRSEPNAVFGRQGFAIDEEFEERAAIIEFCGNVDRSTAESIARKQLRDAADKQAVAPLFAGKR